MDLLKMDALQQTLLAAILGLCFPFVAWMQKKKEMEMHEMKEMEEMEQDMGLPLETDTQYEMICFWVHWADLNTLL
jgi:hypothetical protein